MHLKAGTTSFTNKLFKLDTNSAAILAKVGVTVEELMKICCNTLQQSNDSRWFLERSKRITASLFGKKMKRRGKIYPQSKVSASSPRMVVLRMKMLLFKSIGKSTAQFNSISMCRGKIPIFKERYDSLRCQHL